MFKEHLLRNFTGRAEFEIERKKKISKVRYVACPVEFRYAKLPEQDSTG